MGNRRERLQVEDSRADGLSYELRHTPWKARLLELEARWVPNTAENAEAFRSQVEEAWGLAYLCIWNMRGKHGEHASYTDDERSDAAIHIKKALMNYDPARQSLVKYVEQKSILLLKGAWARGLDIEYDAPEDTPNADAWDQELLQLQQLADGSEDWADNVSDILYARFASRLKSKFPLKDQRRQAMDALKRDLLAYDPRTEELKALVERWMVQVLGGDRKPPADKGVLGTSLDSTIGEDGDSTLGSMIPSDEPSIEARSAKRMAAWDILGAIARVLNFQRAMNPDIAQNNEDHRHQRMCYTEKVLFLAKHSTMPGTGRQDLLRALLESYLDHFALMPPKGSSVNLAALPFKTLEQIEDPDSSPDTWVTPLEWSGANDYLPARVPITYLRHRHGEEATDGSVNRFRRDFYKALKKQAAPNYSTDDIKEILS